MNLLEPFKFSVAYSIHPQKHHNNGFFSFIFIEISAWKMKLYSVNENSILFFSINKVLFPPKRLVIKVSKAG